MSTRTLHLVPRAPARPAQTALTCQVQLCGPQETTVRVLTPVNDTLPGPTVAVRIGPLLLLIGDQDALDDAADAFDQARRLRAAAFSGPAPSR